MRLYNVVHNKSFIREISDIEKSHLAVKEVEISVLVSVESNLGWQRSGKTLHR